MQYGERKDKRILLDKAFSRGTTENGQPFSFMMMLRQNWAHASNRFNMDSWMPWLYFI